MDCVNACGAWLVLRQELNKFAGPQAVSQEEVWQDPDTRAVLDKRLNRMDRIGGCDLAEFERLLLATRSCGDAMFRIGRLPVMGCPLWSST